MLPSKFRPPRVREAIPLALALLAFFVHARIVAASDGKEWAATGTSFDAGKILAGLPQGYRAEDLPIVTRDGVPLATTAFLPPGEGPWPTVLVRTPYGRTAGAKYFKSLCEKGSFACVVQDTRGDGDSGGSPLPDPTNSENEIWDGYDTIDWIAKQPWSNGRVGMTGGSGNGMPAAMAYLAKHPALVVAEAQNSAGNTALNWAFENGVRKHLYEWLSNRTAFSPKAWPRPTLLAYDREKWNAILENAANDNRTVFIGTDGWFNIFGDASLDFFEKFAPGGKIFLTVNASAHGAHCDKGVKFPIRPCAGAKPAPNFLDVLTGKVAPGPSRIVYAVLGDADNADGAGNAKKALAIWPPPNSPTRFYLTPSGGLSPEPPAKGGEVRFPSDPSDPVPTLGGGWSYGNDPNGAMDQRPISSRKDIAKFVSESLADPLEIAGKIRAHLFFSSTATDTMFVVKLVDVYPDGKEILLREAAAMARYRNGFDKPSPLVPGKAYLIDFDCKSIAAVFAPAHRVGIFISSSSHPAYEVHPNTYEPAASASDMMPAEQTLLISPETPSAIILPVVK